MQPRLVILGMTIVGIMTLSSEKVLAQAKYSKLSTASSNDFVITTASKTMVSEDNRITLEAARTDIEIHRSILENQRAIGVLQESDYQSKIKEYQSAIAGYRWLVKPKQNEQYSNAIYTINRDQLLSFTGEEPGDAQRSSVLSEVKPIRGEHGEALFEKVSLQKELDISFEKMRGDLPNDPEHGPALAYLAYLEADSRAQLGSEKDTISMEKAALVVKPVQEYQHMMSGPAWQVALALNSVPENATVVFNAMNKYIEEFTTDTSRNVTRGYVDYIVTLQGYKTISGKKLNLVSAKGIFTCKMVPVESAQSPTPCNIQ